MSAVLRSGPRQPCFEFRRLGIAAAMLSALAAAGCSASITRFDNPSFAIGEGSRSVAAAREPVASGAWELPPPAPASARRPAAAPRSSGGRVDVASLPPIASEQAPTPRAMAVTSPEPVSPAPVSLATAPPAAVPPSAAPAEARGQEIEVRPGDTLYGIAKRHKVMISDLMAANDLKGPNIKPGQKLIVPASGVRPPPAVRPSRTASLRPVAAEPAIQPSPAATADADPHDSYTVKPGDSLYGIAARNKIKVGELQRINNITNVARLKPGTVLRLPNGRAASTPAPAVAAAPASPAATAASNGETLEPESRIVRVAQPVPPSAAPPGVRLLNGGDGATAAPLPADKVASLARPPQTLSDASPATAVRSGKLRWPARGRIVQGFGPRPDGTHNDGIDISVPPGTDVLAAESGVVAYAGNEVKTYGNLVLVRHDNGWVTAYAYNDRLLVQRGDRVNRGQPIAKAGKSGAADQPLVHFEVRVGSRPVDPVGYLEKQ
jgi:murein DD-endopeptidase MepM/ murein hydrolase activator NlpD